MLEEGYTRGYEPVFIPTTALVRQIAKGGVQVNVANYSLDSFDSMLQMLKAGSKGIRVLKLHSQGRSVNVRGPPSQNTSQGTDIGCDPFGHDSYIAATDRASHVASHASQHKKLQDVLLDILSHAPITELHIGMRLATSGYTAISAGLKRSRTLRKLSFAGSRMGDARVALLLGGIISCQSLEVLDLTSCDLGQEAVHTISLAIKEHMQQRVRMMHAATLRMHLDSSLPPKMARQVYETELSNAQHAVEERCGGIKVLHLPYNPKITDNVALHLKDALSMEGTMRLLNLQGCGLSLAVEKEFVDLMKEHVSLVRVDLRHGRGRKGHRLGLIRLRLPDLPPRDHKEQPAICRDNEAQTAVQDRTQEEEDVRLQVSLKVVPDGMEAEHQVTPEEPGSRYEGKSGYIRGSSFREEASAHIRGYMGSIWQPMCIHTWIQTSSKPGTKNGRRGRRCRRKARQKGGHFKERATVGGRTQSAKINRLLTEGSDMLLHGYMMRLQLQQEAADRSRLKQGSKEKQVGGRAGRGRWGDSIWGEDHEELQQEGSGRGTRRKLLEGRAANASRWGDSIWEEDPEELQQGGSAERDRHRQQEDTQRQKEEGMLTEMVELLRRLELAVSKKEYTWALRSHPGACDDAQPMLRLVPGSSTAVQHGSNNYGRSGSHSVCLEPQQSQQSATTAAVESECRDTQGASRAPSLSALKEAWIGAHQALGVCSAAPAPRVLHQMVYQEATALGNAGAEGSQRGEGHGARTASEESRSVGQKQHSGPPGIPKTLAGVGSTSVAKGGLREAAVCTRLEQFAAFCDGFAWGWQPKMERSRHRSI